MGVILRLSPRRRCVGGYFVRVPVNWHLHRDVGVDLLRGGTSSAWRLSQDNR